MKVPSLGVVVKLYHHEAGNVETVGFADVTIAEHFIIKGVRILKSKETGETYVSFPARKGTGASEGKYFDIAHPITLAAREAVKLAVLAAYAQALEAGEAKR